MALYKIALSIFWFRNLNTSIIMFSFQNEPVGRQSRYEKKFFSMSLERWKNHEKSHKKGKQTNTHISVKNSFLPTLHCPIGEFFLLVSGVELQL